MGRLRAAVLDKPGDELRVAELPDPVPGEGQVLATHGTCAWRVAHASARSARRCHRPARRGVGAVVVLIALMVR